MGDAREGELEGMSFGGSAEAIPASRRFGAYTLIKKIAMGGMAEIWLASQKGLGDFRRFVVIKKILGHLAEQPSFVQMFLEEARTCALLNHPNIVQVYDLGAADGTYFLAMEYIAGENLAAISWRGVKRQEPLTPQRAARIIAEACKALHHAHQLRGPNGQPLGMVHRDVSPQNVLVTYEGEVKLVDFGIAKAASKSEHTKTGMLKGKFSYMSPEQCRGDKLDHRSDVFALGIVLYELITRKRLFKHESELMILEMITQRSVVPPSQVAEDVPPKLEAVILKALEKAPEKRFQTAQEMQLALEEYLRGEPRPTTSADVSEYMRRMFDDKIEEKRKLLESAAKGELDAVPLESKEGTARERPGQRGASRARVEMTPEPPPRPASLPFARISPSQPQPPAQPLPPPYLTPPQYGPGSSSGGVSMPGTPVVLGQGSFGSYPMPMPAPPREDQRWTIGVLIAAAVLILGFTGFLAYQGLTAGEVELATRQGGLTLSSDPQGAQVIFDGKPLMTADGTALTTPLELKNLPYGSTHKLRLEKKGYLALERTLEMSERTDRQEMVLALELVKSMLIANIVGDETAGAEVYFGSERVGIGPSVRREVRPGRVQVSARLASGVACAEIPPVQLDPGATVAVTVTCKASARGALARREAEPRDSAAPRLESRTEAVKASAPPPPVEAGPSPCGPTPGAAPGLATIDAVPYADLYIGGKKIGQTPLPNYQLPSGCVELRAVHPDSGREKTVRLQILPGQVTRQMIEL